jgi:tetratricopeptide (TPR) repeat protein
VSSWRIRVNRLQDEIRGKTEPVLRDALAQNPGPKEHLHLGVFLAQNDRPAEGAEIFEQAARSIGSAFFLPAARSRELAGNLALAEVDYRAAMRSDNRHGATLEYGDFLWRRGRFVEAASQFHDAGDILREAAAVIKSGDFERGEMMIINEVRQGPTFPENYKAYAAIMNETGKNLAAAQALETGAFQCHDPELLLLAIPQYLKAGRRDHAERIAERAIDRGIGITNVAQYLDSETEKLASGQQYLSTGILPSDEVSAVFDTTEVGL